MDSNVQKLKKEQGARLRAAREAVLGADSTASDGAAYLRVSRDSYLQHENGTRSYIKNWAEKYADGFGVTASWLAFGDDEQSQKSDDPYSAYGTKLSSDVNHRRQKIPLQRVRVTHNVPILGKVEAGAWRTMFNDSIEPESFIPLDAPDLEGVDLFAYEVNGLSMNEVFREGDRLICQKFRRADLRDKDFVIIRDTEGSLAEITVKEFRVGIKGAWEFWPRSTDARYKVPLIMPERNEYQQSGPEIIGIVLFVAPAPLRRIGRLIG